MKSNKKFSVLEPTLETVHNQVAIFFLGTLSLIGAFLLYGQLINNPLLNFVPSLLVLLWFTCYFLNAFYFSVFYFTKANEWARESYKKHEGYYWLFTVIIFIVIVAAGAYHFLSWEKFVETTYSTLSIAALGLIGWILREKIYKPWTEKQKEKNGK
jgi:hypothetical protein